MNAILEKRLKECNVSLESILRKVEGIADDSVVVVYTSHLEGLGTKESDFDVYVITDINSNQRVEKTSFRTMTYIINGVQFDVEYWELSVVQYLIDKVNTSHCTEIRLDELKLLNRLRTGEVITNENDFVELKNRIVLSNLGETLLDRYVLLANSQLNDAISLYKSKYYISALNCSHSSIEYAIGAYCAKKDILIVKPKWISQKFVVEEGHDSKLVKKYLDYQVYFDINPQNIEGFVEEKLGFIQELLSSIALL